MADELIAQTLSGMLPEISGSGIMAVVIWVCVALLLAGAGIWGYWAWYSNKKFNKTIRAFQKVGSDVALIITCKGMFQRVGNAGDFWLVLKGGLKKTLPRPRKQMAPNEFWYFIRDDGEWVNFSLKDFDAEMRKAGAYFVDEDMRLQRLGIQKNLQERFQKISFWDKYGGMIMNLMYMVVTVVLLVVLFKEMKDNWIAGMEMASAVRDMAVEVANLRRQTGSGMQPIVATMIPLLLGWKK